MHILIIQKQYFLGLEKGIAKLPISQLVQYYIQIKLVCQNIINLKNISMNFENLILYETRSRKSTEEDSSSDKDQEVFHLKTNPLKHKTELCKTFSELGYCPYDLKCRFAHGRHELVALYCNPHTKNKKCNGFWKNGFCPYGLRCQFGHAEVKWESKAVLHALEASTCTRVQRGSKLMKLMD